MSNGVIVELNELIALQRFARKENSKWQSRATSAGNYVSTVRGRGMDFAEVRHYQEGDDIRQMEWRVTARTGRPHVKLYHEERERPVIIVTDFSPSMYFATRVAFKSVIAAQLSALIAWTAIKQGDKVGGLLSAVNNHQEFTPKSRHSAVLPFLNALSQYTYQYSINDSTSTERPFIDGLQRLGRVAKPGSLIVLISDFYHFNEQSFIGLQRLVNHTDILAYHICDPIEMQPPVAGSYAVSNGREEMMLDTANHAVARAYQGWCEQREIELNTAFKRLLIKPITVLTTDDLPKIVYKTYPRRTHG